MTRLVVLASGTGTNLQAILDACADNTLPAQVVAVVSNKAGSGALQRAGDAGVPHVHVPVHAGEPRSEYDARLADIVSGFDPDWIVLAGWMRVLSMSFLGWFPNMVVNLHPALPGELPGTDRQPHPVRHPAPRGRGGQHADRAHRRVVPGARRGVEFHARGHAGRHQQHVGLVDLGK